jgi:heptosyltransferase I
MTRLPDLRAVRRVLIIRLSSIGDVVHALPVSAALGEAFPHLELTWIVEESAADVVAGNPYLHDVIVVPRERWKRGRKSPHIWREYLGFLRMLRERHFEVSLDLQGYAKSGLMAWAARAPHRLGWWKLHDIAGLVSRPLPHRPESVHRVDWFLDVARALGAEPETARFPLLTPPEAFAQAKETLCRGGIDPNAPYVVVNAATGDKMRRWGTEPYAQLITLLAQRYGLPSVLIGSRRDIPLCEEITQRVGMQTWPEGVPPPLILAGQTNLKELSALLQGCAAQVCGDTGSAHIAAAVDCPTICVYGPSDPAHAGPWGQEANVLSGRSLCQSGCSLERQCCAVPLPPAAASGSLSIAHCLRSISPETVADRVGQTLHALSPR